MPMKFIADLHIHSHFSRATSKSLDPEHLALWAQKKGIRVVGTGDFTHPGWVSELQILMDVPLSDIEVAWGPILSEAIGRMRRNQVIREEGYDGEYGIIQNAFSTAIIL
jgi:PHP family Zn ribbon phosphoesterase